jgi:hypothetical protein
MKRWRLLNKKRNKSGKFKKPTNILYLDGDPAFATGGIVLPYGLGNYVTV